MSLKTLAGALLACTAVACCAVDAQAAGVNRLDHVFVIMMENHGNAEIIGNPNLPFINKEAAEANLATNYFAVAHPSLTNYLEVVGGSNFGVTDDNAPDWHNAACQPNIATGVPNNETDPNPICPIAGLGTDTATAAIDYTNETSGPPGVLNIDGTKSYAAAPVAGQTIGDQLAVAGMSWKSYQENLPQIGADGVDYSDGSFTNLTNFSGFDPAFGFSTSQIVQLYAVKHDPFAYFASVQSGVNKSNSLANIVPFDSGRGLYADLASGHVPNFSFIAPNQCNDQHGRGNAGVFCAYDPNDNGTLNGLNPLLMKMGDKAVDKLVHAIKASPAWTRGRNAIVIVWDESDYAIAPITNQVTLIVDTSRGSHGVQSSRYYNHFDLLNTIETGFGLRCLNHACDAQAKVMGDLFN